MSKIQKELLIEGGMVSYDWKIIQHNEDLAIVSNTDANTNDGPSSLSVAQKS